MEDEFIDIVPKNVFEQDFELFIDAEGEQELVAAGLAVDEKIYSEWRKLARIASKNLVVFGKFVEKLEDRFRHIGRLHCAKQSKQESCQDWHVFCRQNLNETSLCVKSLLHALTGAFLFLPRFDQRLESLLPQIPTETSFRFFVYFGGIRESAPHFGGNYFSKAPHEFPPEGIRSRSRVESEWPGCEVIHTSGNCNYLVLSRTGKVGYVPINGDRRIEVYAATFDEAIMRWMDELA